jgi:hypothetical protein
MNICSKIYLILQIQLKHTVSFLLFGEDAQFRSAFSESKQFHSADSAKAPKILLVCEMKIFPSAAYFSKGLSHQITNA